MNRFVIRLTTAAFLLISNLTQFAEEQGNTSAKIADDPDEAVLRRVPSYFFTTEAYKREALRVLIEQANRVAKQLNLPEKLPITASNLIEVFIRPPGSGAIGTIPTTNYTYIFDYGRKFSGIDQRNNIEAFYQAKEEYTWPISRFDTNQAFQMATQIMTAVELDVSALNQDCTVEIHVPKMEGFGGTHFIPDYWVTWRNKGKTVAFVEFVEPIRSIRQFIVKDPKYFLGGPIRIPNLAELLDQTNGPPRTNAPLKQ